MSNMFFILVVICTLFCWIIYHKIFTVYYADVGKGLLNEFITSAILGTVLAMLILILFVKFWYIIIALLGIVIFCLFMKK